VRLEHTQLCTHNQLTPASLSTHSNSNPAAYCLCSSVRPHHRSATNWTDPRCARWIWFFRYYSGIFETRKRRSKRLSSIFPLSRGVVIHSQPTARSDVTAGRAFARHCPLLTDAHPKTLPRMALGCPGIQSSYLPYDVAGSCRSHRWSEWSPFYSFPEWLELRCLSSGSGPQPDLVCFLESRGTSQAIVAALHPVTGHWQVDVMQPIHDVRHVVGRRLHPVGGSPKKLVTGQT
jgi:hypothetical protein